MKNKTVKLLAMVMVATSLLTGCGKDENASNTSSYGNSNVSTETQNNIEQVEGDAGSAEQAEIKGLEEAENYKLGEIKKFADILEKNGMSYETTDNELGIFWENTETTLEVEYKTFFRAFSVTDYPNDVIHTMSEMQCRFHKEKGANEEYLNLLYEVIQNSKDEVMKSSIDSVDTLRTKFENEENVRGTFSAIQFSELGSGIIVDYASIQDVGFEKEEVEVTYLEFNTKAEYDVFRQELQEIFGYCIDSSIIPENKFAVGIGLDSNGFSEIFADSTHEWFKEMLDEFCSKTGIGEKEKENAFNDYLMWNDMLEWHLLDSPLDEIYNFEIGDDYYAQYPYEVVENDYGNLYLVAPVKVEGVLSY